MSDEQHQPTPEERAEFFVGVTEDLAVAVRLMSAMHARDRDGVHAVSVEIVQSGRGLDVTFALALQALAWAKHLVPDEDALGKQLDALAMHNLDAAEVLGQAWRDGGEAAGNRR
jgi:hypothetical protein